MYIQARRNKAFERRHTWHLFLVAALVATLLTGFAGRASALPIGTVGDAGFEEQNSRVISAPWSGEGPDYKGIDIDLGYQKTGRKNAFIRTSSRNWNAVTQRVSVKPQTVYYLEGWVRTSGNYTTGYFGARGTNGRTIVQKNYGKVISNGAYQFLRMAFNSGTNTSVTLYAGYNAPGTDSWVQIDDISLADSPYSNWAGYLVPSSPVNAAPRAVTAVWTEPAFSCRQENPDNQLSVWVGLDGFDASSTESLVQVGVHATCLGDLYPEHRAFWEVVNAGVDTREQPVPMLVQAGDRMSASVVRSTADPADYILTLDNLSRPGQRQTLTKKAPAARSESAEVVVERPHVFTLGSTWPPAVNVPFSYVTVDGAPLSAYDALPLQARQNDTGTVYSPSPATTDSGGYSNFTLTSHQG
ncbi:peptidase A4-like protein [Streptomyces sp. Ag109_G2-6]|uniref:G1 family glutamic endopeptidase n=1 Tax=Streptomyces TaxID=1883 RepID=UPI0009A4E11F|nr:MULTISPECIES: G1 family glutamic endopeptidase [Streptomyces]RPF43717.1 peptidase A4-like protein [Streptomyces sp. Ag109_G2-6]